MRLRLRGDPTITLHYGVTQATSNDLSKNFRRLGNIEVRLGYRKTEWGIENYLVDYTWHGVSVSHYAEGIRKTDPASNNINTKAWQFGLGSESGDGYSFDKTSIIPYRSSTYGWTRFNSDFFGVAPGDSTFLLLYNGTFRFGQSGGMGVLLQFVPVVALDLVYKRGVVFSRHLFFKHLGSVVVEEVAHGLLSRFVESIFESSPTAGPLLGFLLHSGITYAVYELRKEDMHWPFSTASPINYDTFTVGVRLNL